MDYDAWKAGLMAVSPISDPAQLDQKLPGRLRYDPSTLGALPFEGISVIHNIDPKTATALGLSQMVDQLKSNIASAGLGTKIAFVDTQSFHATTFDLINEPEHRQTVTKAGHSYPAVRQQVEDASIQFLRDAGLAISAKVTITGIGMFSPNVIKLNLRFDDVVSKVFQAFRLGLHRYLLEHVTGYSAVRDADWNKKLSGHITFAYVIDRMTQQEVDALINVLRECNSHFQPITFQCTQGEVTGFVDMDRYTPVQRTLPNQMLDRSRD